ncbi:hypothetical protein R3P38DRAFT_1581610 [Favolaschia claudopus]|uniref:Uncharacterized protein n=1 Tax=Favolaschia claudopus TaxID=2862362 RepID=A0AAW0AIW3_9AGAR
MSTPPPPSGYARCLRALPFLVFSFLSIGWSRHLSTLGGPFGAMSSLFHLLAIKMALSIARRGP